MKDLLWTQWMKYVCGLLALGGAALFQYGYTDTCYWAVRAPLQDGVYC